MTIPQKILDTFKPDACVGLEAKGDKENYRGCLFIEIKVPYNMHVFIDCNQLEAENPPAAWAQLAHAATVLEVTELEYERWLNCRSLEEPVHLPFAMWSVYTPEELEEISRRP